MTQISSARSKYRSAAVWLTSFTIVVILWGVFVRLSHSGDGCGVNWPLCQGALFPQNASIEAVIEYTHRVLSGLSFLGVLALWIASRKLYSETHIARRSASLAMIFMVVEALIGAALVLFGWTGSDTSVMRGVALSVHLVNTMLLLGSIYFSAITAESEDGAGFQSIPEKFWWALGILIVISATGAIASLAGTLFPAESFMERVSQDFSESSHPFLRLRVLHPLIAVIGFVFLLRMARREQARTFTMLLIGQMIYGCIGLVLGKSLLYTLSHLLIADVMLLNLCSLAWVKRKSLAETAK